MSERKRRGDERRNNLNEREARFCEAREPQEYIPPARIELRWQEFLLCHVVRGCPLDNEYKFPWQKRTRAHHRRSRRQSDGETEPLGRPSTLFCRARGVHLSFVPVFLSCTTHRRREDREPIMPYNDCRLTAPLSVGVPPRRLQRS